MGVGAYDNETADSAGDPLGRLSVTTLTNLVLQFMEKYNPADGFD